MQTAECPSTAPRAVVLSATAAGSSPSGLGVRGSVRAGGGGGSSRTRVGVVGGEASAARAPEHAESRGECGDSGRGGGGAGGDGGGGVGAAGQATAGIGADKSASGLSRAGPLSAADGCVATNGDNGGASAANLRWSWQQEVEWAFSANAGADLGGRRGGLRERLRAGRTPPAKGNTVGGRAGASLAAAWTATDGSARDHEVVHVNQRGVVKPQTGALSPGGHGDRRLVQGVQAAQGKVWRRRYRCGAR